MIDWQQFANLRAYFACMYAHPGKKLLFMGSELAQHQEWSHDRSLDWHLLEHAPHRGIQANSCETSMRSIGAPPRCTRSTLPTRDSSGSSWDDRDNSVFSWLRRDASGNFVICVSNLTPVVRHDFRIGVPVAGTYRELLNTDAERYGGGNIGTGDFEAVAVGSHGRDHSIALTLPPLSTVILEQPSS